MTKKNSLYLIYNALYRHFGPRDWWPGETRIEIIIGAILTQNTSWANVEKAISNLKKEKLLGAKKLSGLPKRKLARLIRPAGYYNVKAKRIKSFLAFLNSEHGGSISRMFRVDPERLRERLLSVNGIGEETADSILLYAGEKPFFVVDAYTRRIFSRHGYVNPDAGYSETQRLFTKSLKKDVKLFNEYHALIVELGKTVCKTKKPLCKKCPIRRIKNG